MLTTISLRRWTYAEIAAAATWALREEAMLTPKPGMVDRRGTGAHRDMDLALMLRSACSLEPTFRDIAECAQARPFGIGLRRRLADIGLAGEAVMLAATVGVNTHRGAIWSLGLLCAAKATTHSDDASVLCEAAARIARLPIMATTHESHGRSMLLRHGARGARGEAEDGFPHVLEFALPALREARATMRDESLARLHALVTLIATVDDTCLLYRGGRRALELAQEGAKFVLAAGVETSEGFAALLELDRQLIEINASPGGCADLLATTLMLDRFTAEDVHGDA